MPRVTLKPDEIQTIILALAESAYIAEDRTNFNHKQAVNLYYRFKRILEVKHGK